MLSPLSCHSLSKKGVLTVLPSRASSRLHVTKFTQETIKMKQLKIHPQVD